MVRELVENDRVIGGMTDKCSQAAMELYSTFVEGDCVITNARTAEMAKLTENSCRDVQIAFANELSVICDKLDIDVWELISLANRHPRINILQPGPGVVCHCIAVDPWFIVSKTHQCAQLIHTARLVNDSNPHWVIDKVKLTLPNILQTNPENPHCGKSLVPFIKSTTLFSSIIFCISSFVISNSFLEITYPGTYLVLGMVLYQDLH